MKDEPARQSVQILGVPVDAVTEADVLAFIEARITAEEGAHIVTVNSEYVMQARENPEFRRVIERADLRTPDSAGILVAAWRRGLPIRARVGGSDLIWSVSRRAADRGDRLFLLGAAPGVAEAAAARLREYYPGLLIAGTYSGSPSPSEDDVQASMVANARSDIVLVAFGSPQQDLWISRNRERLEATVMIGVGGSFDYVAGTAVRAPRWMRRVGLEWIWRLSREPKRWRRMSVLPLFAVLALVRRD